MKLPPSWFVQPPTGRGRPGAKDGMTWADLSRTPSVRIATAVYAEQAKIGSQRGSLTEAIRRVAARLHIPVATVKKNAQRYRDLCRLEQFAFHQIREGFQELDRRMLGFPDDVRDALLERWHFSGLLAYLRENDIDGTCPRDLIEYVRRELLSPK